MGESEDRAGEGSIPGWWGRGRSGMNIVICHQKASHTVHPANYYTVVSESGTCPIAFRQEGMLNILG